MAQPEPKRWHRAAWGGVLVALGSVLFGAARKRASVKIGTSAEAGASAKKSAEPAPTGAGKGGAEASGKARPGRSGARSRPKVGHANVRTKPRAAEAPARTQYWPPPPPAPLEPSGDVHRAEGAARDDALPVHRDSATRGYEVEDARTAAVVKIMAFGVSTIVISIAALFWFIGHSHRDDRLSPPLTPQQLALIVPPGPRLQDHPLHDIAMERKREADLLAAYAWTDASRRTARIPIARAQALVVGRSLDPAPPAAARQPDAPTPSAPPPPMRTP